MENQKAQSAKYRDSQNVMDARMEGSKIKEKYTRGGAPFHTDNMSVWERRKTDTEVPVQTGYQENGNPSE